ncbi:ATP/GTP-binding protein [Amycolatopsis sp.]|uniref:GTP-binding protein n=1 Tax=Amycolatopsis sp. TaxID=37632 RepID=UPI00261AF148|nr:ATP/GTP-binding protein [Amycolatopsis sp.]
MTLSRRSELTRAPSSVKIVISGGFGVGKTTFIGAISEIEPLVTEAAMTEVSAGVDDATQLPLKSTTTVALDFGRITLDDSLIMYLFGTPGQERFVFLWDDLVDGALGAVVLVDTRRIDDCYPVLDYFEEQGTPFIVAVNHFSRAEQFELDEVREALGVGESVPLIGCDARDRESVKEVLVMVIEQVLMQRLAETVV